ncbi:MAG: putative calcium-binding acidic-repeat protein [Parcubacteria group bacterium GW2011_GWC2_49_9]|nr:MAG: putative calcium-binding acidic-repeat protein [Parcubacteria group bacterium GW2011_GWC2_49_9]
MSMPPTQQPKDMYENVTPQPARQTLRAPQQAARQRPASIPPVSRTPSSAMKSLMGNRSVALTGVILAIIVIAVVVVVFFNPFEKTATNEPVANTNTEPSILPSTISPPSNTGSVSDADSDGLPDAEEQSLGTNAQNADSDSDQLFDREEVKVYLTNPTNPDTDGDGVIDGQEVAQGQNPSGAGLLRDLPSEIQKLQ